MQGFLERLRAAGVDPDAVITDGSPLYPTTLAAVWPTAAHQLCLFHQTRAVTKSVVQVIREIRATVPTRPTPPTPPTPPARRPGRRGQRPADPAAAAVGEPDYAQGPAAVHQLHRQGVSIHGIVRQTGFARNTVRRWLRVTPTGEDDTVVPRGSRRGDLLCGRRGLRREAPAAPVGPTAPTVGELGAGPPGER